MDSDDFNADSVNENIQEPNAMDRLKQNVPRQESVNNSDDKEFNSRDSSSPCDDRCSSEFEGIRAENSRQSLYGKRTSNEEQGHSPHTELESADTEQESTDTGESKQVSDDNGSDEEKCDDYDLDGNRKGESTETIHSDEEQDHCLLTEQGSGTTNSSDREQNVPRQDSSPIDQELLETEASENATPT
ncbi:uncharacterized G-patch domain protein DDB_G0278987-like [Haliotis asinina]|uniref:uncharacterized G-patch domain protein DDB_G0278987-like n=1 Tax=Haliotis asinina TaxID=109174 RepID=UPI00353270E5